MNTLTQKDKLALQVSLALVAGMFSLVPVAQGAPVLEKVVTGGATVHQSDDKTMTAVVPGNTSGVSNNVINWKDYSIGQNEKVIFDAHDEAGSSWTKTNNYLNVVTGNGTSYIDGAMKGGNNVYVVNPNGVIMGEHADIDVGNLYVSTKKLNPDNYVGTTLEGASVLGNTDPQAEVVNMGKIQANSVYAEGTSIRFYNTKDIQYKAITNISDTSDTDLPPLSSTSNAATNSGVKLKGTEYVHVGYEAAAKATSMAQTADESGQYYAPDGTYAASTLGYVINGSAYSFDKGVNKYDYALVRNDHELQNMNSNKSINYMVSLKDENTDVIDLSENYKSIDDGKYFTPIGNYSDPFKGGFDGNFHKISGLTVIGKEYAGLFGYTINADIRNVGIVNPMIVAGTGEDKDGYGGALVGVADHTVLENVYSVADDPQYNIGALEYSITETVDEEEKTIAVYEGQGIGGLVGKATNGTNIENAYNTADVLNGGGIVGILDGGSSIENAYNTGNLVNVIDANRHDIFKEDTSTVHYGIVDDANGASSIKNVYNTGKYIPSNIYSQAYDAASASVASLVPSANTGIITNGYIVEPTISDGVVTSATITPVGTNSAVESTSADGLKAKSYGFFSADANGKAKQSSDDWRIYDDHSLPLLRSFLRANGNGTIPVSFDLNLYADKETNTQPANNTPIKYNSNDVVYNGYYIGASNVKSDSSRNITSGIEAGSGRIKNASESATLFYSTSQDGYDIADSTINIVKRNLVPPYDMTISKVYDGTAVATDEMRAAFGASGSAIDVADVYNRTGVLVETGLVKSFGVTPENVTLSGNAIQSATYYKSGTDSSNSANWVVNVSQAPDKEHAVPVNVKWNDSVAIDTSNQTKTDGITLDHKNYDFDVTDFKNGTNTVSGYITPRPVYVQLQTPDGIDKVYDSTDNVVYKESGWASAASNVQNVSADAGVALGLSDYGVVASDNATLSVANPYYTTGDGTGTVPNAGTGYTANYPVTLTSTNTGFEAGNYAIYTYTPASGTGDSVTPASPVILNTDNNGNFLMTGTGKINTRTVSTTSAEFWYKDADGNLHAPANTKIYDNSSAYNGSVFVGENQNGANYVDFGVGGAYIIPEDAVAHAGEEAYSKGIISVDAEKFHFALDPTQTKFYNEAKTDSADEATGANAPSGNDVDKRAKYIRYAVTVNGDADVLNNYNMIDENGDPVSMTSSTENPYISFYKEGRIEKRPVYLTLNQSAGINKQYNGDAGLVDTANRVYGAHTDANANGNVTYDASASTDYKKLDDGTSWSVKAAYQRTGDEETAAKDVRKENGVVYDDHKAINYDVSLIGDKADNYILYVGNNAYDQAAENNAARLNATGKITPVTINKVTFADVSKSYDTTANVGKVGDQTQANNYINITDVTDANGNSVLVTGESVKDVFGGEKTGTGDAATYQYIDANGHYTRENGDGSSFITGLYGTNNTDMGDDFESSFHAYNGAARKVEYANLHNAITNDNYELVNDYTGTANEGKQYGSGHIDPLEITSLSYGTNNVLPTAEKVYDGNAYLVKMNGTGDSATPTTYKVDYNDDGTVNSAETVGLTSSVVGSDTIGVLRGSNEALNVSNVPLDYTVEEESIFVKDDGSTPTANVADARKVKYKLTVADGSGYGDYKLADPVGNTTYTADVDTEEDVAYITGAGSIAKRRVYTDDIKQSKTYDGNEFITATGESVLRMNGGDETEQVTGLLSGATNASTAVYSADAGDGYRVHDANAYVDYDATTNADAHFRSLDDKTVTFTPTITTGTGDNVVNVTGNYEFFHNGAVVNGDTIATTGHAIKQRDLAVGFADIAKTFDENDYVKNHGVNLTAGNGNPVYNVLTYNGNITDYNGVADEVNISTQDTSQFLPLPNSTAADSSTYAGTHDVRYDLTVSGDNYRNYRLVKGIVNPSGSSVTATDIVLETGTNESGVATATGLGSGVINSASADSANATFGTITKVYDTEGYVRNSGYVPTSPDEIVSPYRAEASSYVTGLTLGTYDMTGKYSVLGALYDTVNVGDGLGITYTFKITDTDFLNNVSLANLPGLVSGTTDTFTYRASGNITPKDVYATLASTVAPDKTYNRDTNWVNVKVNGVDTPVSAAKSYVSIEGLFDADADKYTVSPTYATRDVMVDSAGNVLSGQHNINYQVGLVIPDGLARSNYNLRSNESGSTEDTAANTVTLVGKGTISPKEITFNPGKATKVYDATADVNFATNDPTLGFEGLVTGDSLTVATTGDNAIAGKYGNIDGTTFTENANVAFVSDTSDEVADKAVRYTNVWSATSGTGDTLKTNYVLGGANYSSDNGGTVTFAADEAKGRINKLALNSITADVSPVTKVYDGSGTLTYDHRGDLSYDEGQRATYANAADSVNQLVLTPTNGTALNLDYGYTVDNDGTYFTDSNAGGNKTITYTFKIDRGVMRSFDLSNFDYDANRVTPGDYGSYIKKHDDTNVNNIITPKNVYATLTDLATSSAPTKVYNGIENVVNNTQADPTGTDKDVSGYVAVTGLVNDDAIGVHDAATIKAQYKNKNVAGENGSVVEYTATITNPTNYKLYTKNAAGQVVDANGNATTAVNNVLKGYGTITPKELKFQAGYTQKTYDNETSTIAKNVNDNKYNENEAIYNADNPKYQFVGLVNGETLTPDADKITGDYVVAGSGEGFVNGYKKDSHVEATLNDDGSVKTVDFKAVQYTGVGDAFANATGTADQNNYVLNGAVNANGVAAEYFSTGNGTAVYGKELENGKIFRKQLNADDITSNWVEGATKVYDTSSKVKDPEKWFSIHTIKENTDGVEYQLGYTLGEDYGAQYTEADDVTKPVKDADTGYNMRYQITGLSGETAIDFDLSGLTDNAFTGFYNSKDNTVNNVAAPVYGDITKYKIRGSAEGGNIKTYDGNRTADESYFKFNPDDEAFVQSDLGESLKDLVDVTAKYYGEHGENEDSAKNATISPDGEAQNKRQVVYSLGSLAGNDELKNYELDKDTYNGTGDIRQREVYVVDKGGEVITKTYDGSKDWPDDIEATAAGSRFELADPNDDAKTGVIKAEKDNVTLNKVNITGEYRSPNVERNENGEVVNTGVKYKNFALAGDVNNNYYLTVDKNNPTGSLPNTSKAQGSVTYEHGADGIIITEEKGGRINPKEIAVNVINSPEKEYNRDFDVNGSKDGIKYASVNNLEVKIGDDVKEGVALSDTVRTISTGINNDKVTIALNEAEYEDKNVSYNDLGQVQSNKVNYFDLSWDNGNYKLVGESEDITGASGDTLTQGYDAVKATFTGRLTDYTGTINPRLIDVTKVDKVVKTYDGDAVVESNPTFNITDADTSNPHFYIDDKDKALLVDDKLDSYLAISGNYENKNANIYPKEYSEEAAEGGKKVNYNLVWNGGDEDARRNYKFADAGEYDITGTGDILRRAVNVTDNGGDVLTREYRGTKDTSLPKADLTNRFAEERNVSGTGSTGIIDADVTLDKGAITGVYAPNGDVARDTEGNVINKAVTFSGFELQGTVDGTTGFNSKDNYYLTAQDGTVTLNGGVVSDVDHTIGKNGELLTITEKEGGRIDPRKIYISVEKSPTKVYDGDNLVKNDKKTGTAYASASNLKAAADGADVQRSFGNVNNVVSFTLDPGSGESESFDVTLEKATYDNTSTDPEKDNSMDVSRGANREVLKDKITSYNLSWTNGNYDLKSEPASAEAGKQADTFAADGTNGYTDGSGKRTGVLKDYGGEITPKTISVTSMDTSKTYSGKEGYVVANPQVDAEIEGIIAKDMPGNGNVQDFLGLTVGKATYGAPTQAAIDEAQAENAPKNKKATADEIAEANPWDAAFNRTADPFQHQVAYSGIAITNGNYELADDEFDGTGTINRAVVTAHPKSATIKAGEAMPSFKGTLDGFMDGETMPKTFYTTVENEDGTKTTTSETRQVPLSEYYNDPEFIYWGPEDGVTNRTEGTNPVYGWYLRKELGEDKDGNEVVSYYKEKEANLDKNYTLVQAEEPSTLVVEPAPRSGGGGGSGSIVSPPVRESTPVYITPSVPTPAAPQPQPVLEVGYVEKPVVADSSVYQNVSKDTSNSANNEAQAAIQYGKKGAGIAAGNDDSGKSSTIAIELAEVVNLLGGDVASDGSMSLTNTDSGRKLSVGSTEEGYLSVGAERKEGSIGIETEGENILEEMAAKEGSIGIESEEAQAEVRTEDKEGQIELETEEEMLDAEGKKSSISLRSEGRDGESEITYSDGDLSILNSLNADKKKEQKGEEDEEDSEKSESREGEAAIAYNDVA